MVVKEDIAVLTPAEFRNLGMAISQKIERLSHTAVEDPVQYHVDQIEAMKLLISATDIVRRTIASLADAGVMQEEMNRSLRTYQEEAKTAVDALAAAFRGHMERSEALAKKAAAERWGN